MINLQRLNDIAIADGLILVYKDEYLCWQGLNKEIQLKLDQVDPVFINIELNAFSHISWDQLLDKLNYLKLLLEI